VQLKYTSQGPHLGAVADARQAPCKHPQVTGTLVEYEGQSTKDLQPLSVVAFLCRTSPDREGLSMEFSSCASSCQHA